MNDRNRSQLYREFNFQNQVIALYDIDVEIQSLKDKLNECEIFRQDKVSQLPEAVYRMYEEQQCIWRLKGDKDE